MALAGAFTLGFFAFHGGDARPAAAPRPVWHHGPQLGYGPFPPPVAADEPPLALEQVRLALATAYYRHIDPEWLAQPSIEAILEKLDDPYTEYLPPAEYEAFKAKLETTYAGVGLTVDAGEHGLVVRSLVEGPAREAGIRRGDVIVSIDGRPEAGLPFDQSLALIKGKEGTTVRFVIRRPGHRKEISLEVVRQPIDVPAVRWRLREAHGHALGYIRLLAFESDAAELVREATEELVAKGAEGLVLDLRGDPGG